MKAAWSHTELGKVVTLQRGYDLTYRDRRPGSIPVVTSTGITDWHAVARERGPGVVTGRYGTIGEVFFIPGDYWPHNTSLFVRDFHGNDPLFIAYLLRTVDWQTHSGKSGVPGINRNDIHELTVFMPPTVAEQRAIAGALSDADGLLGGLDRLIAKKRDLKQAAMQQLLTGQTRLPGFHGEWEVKRLGELADIRSGGTPSTTDPKFWDGEVPWCTPTDITALNSHKYLRKTSRRITQHGLKCSSAEMIPAYSIVMTSRATIGECAINRVPVSTNQGFKNFVPFQQVDVEFFYYLLLTQKQGFISLCGGSTFLEIGKGQLAAYEVHLPCEKSEQTAIAEVLTDMDTELAALEQRREKTRALKQAMMQELLTGRIRLVCDPPNVISLPVERSKSGVAEKPHNWEINEAVVISVLAKQFGSECFPLGRKRYTKLSYLLHRHHEGNAQGYLKKAAGPYNPATKYKGPEPIAQKNGYIRRHSAGQYSGFVADRNIAQAEGYFEKWYGNDVLTWLEQLRYKTNDELELLATVDMAVEEIRQTGTPPTVAAVKEVIRSHPEWEAKLSRPIFSDEHISSAMSTCEELFPHRPNPATGETKPC